MRFYEIKKLLEAEQTNNVVIIGDSIAVGIGGGEPYAKSGISAKEVLNRVNSFIKTGNAKGATVILSTGAGNSARFELENGGEIQSRLGTYPAQQVRALVAAGASVSVVGAPSKKSTWFPGTSWTKGVRYRVDPTGVNDQLEQAATANGAKFLGPLEDYDPGMHSGKGDGLHPFGGYKKLYQAGVDKTSGNAKAADTKTADILKAGPPYPPEQYDAIKKLQKDLEAIGYSVGSTGLDGKYGPRTTRAVRAFKTDYKVDGDGLSINAEGLKKLSDIATGKEKKVEKPTDTGNTAGSRYVSKADPNAQSPGYPPGMTVGAMEQIISREATARNMDPKTAIKIFRAEGASHYQSQIPKKGKGSHAGKEASFGPYQLYTGGGMGNQYEKATGRNLTTDNTVDGITNQIRFALDQATKVGWSPWMGRGPAGVAADAGLKGSKAINNWS